MTGGTIISADSRRGLHSKPVPKPSPRNSVGAAKPLALIARRVHRSGLRINRKKIGQLQFLSNPIPIPFIPVNRQTVQRNTALESFEKSFPQSQIAWFCSKNNSSIKRKKAGVIYKGKESE